MVSENRLLKNAALEVVQDIDEPCDDYHTRLVVTFTGALQILRDESNRNRQRKGIENLINGLAAEVNERLGES